MCAWSFIAFFVLFCLVAVMGINGIIAFIALLIPLFFIIRAGKGIQNLCTDDVKCRVCECKIKVFDNVIECKKCKTKYVVDKKENKITKQLNNN